MMLLLLACLSPPPPDTVALSPCHIDGVDAETLCTTIEVWEDRDAQSGRKIPLRVVVSPALSGEPEPDPLFFLAGGPGQAASDLVGPLIDRFPRTNRTRDFVFVDQRGTGASNPLDCPEVDPLMVMSPSASFYKDCLAELDADTRLYTTPIAMDDLDDVRAALGYERINLVGMSYGTRAALVYLRQHGEHVRSAVLDGVAPYSMKLYLPMGDDAQAALDATFSACRESEACTKYFPDPAADFAAVVAALPQTVRLPDPRTSDPLTLTVTPELWAMGVRAFLYDTSLTAMLPHTIARAKNGDFAPFAAQLLAFSGSTQLSLGMHLSVACAEDIPRITAEEQAAAAHNFMGDILVPPMRDACAIWPAGTLPDGYFEPIVSDVPTLLLSGEADPVTPPHHAEAAAATLSRSRHLVVPGTGHGTVQRDCIAGRVRSFIQDPRTDIDATCVKSIERPSFFVDAMGPTALESR